MSQTTASKNFSGSKSRVLDSFKTLSEELQAKIIMAGIFAMCENFKQEEKNEIFRFLRSYVDNR